MIVRILEVLTEYVCIIACIHKLSNKKIIYNSFYAGLLLLGLFIDIFINLAIDRYSGMVYAKLVVYLYILFYMRKRVFESLKSTVTNFAIMLMCIIPLQVIVFIILKSLKLRIIEMSYGGVIINIIVSIIIILIRKEMIMNVLKKIEQHKNLIIAVTIIAIFSAFLWLYNKGFFIEGENVIQLLMAVIGIGCTCVFLILAERENKYKSKELQMYKTYTNAFEDTIKTVRLRQHEFENHINAILCMQYMINSYDDLIEAQTKYCKMILQENKFNKLLSLKIEPILIGFLYSKFTKAYEKGILTTYTINVTKYEEFIRIYDLIELIGIIYDNAVDKLEKSSMEKRILFKLLEIEDRLILEIDNISELYKNNEIEKFGEFGYSTKSGHNGIGLCRVKDIVNQANGKLYVQNLEYEKNNYLSFYIELNKIKK